MWSFNLLNDIVIDMEKPIVSTVVITHNNGELFVKALSSLINQSFDLPYEIIVINDSSNDNTEHYVLEMMKNHSSIVYKAVNNKSASLSRFDGVKAARGEYITFLDGDDYYHKDYLKTMYKAIKDNNADIVNCSLYYVRDKNKIVRSKLGVNRIYNSKERAVKALFDDCSVHGFMHTKMYKADLIKSFDAELLKEHFVYEDVLINYMLFKQINRLVNIKKPLLYYNKTNENSITLSSRRIQDQINVTAFIRKDIELLNNKKLLKIFRNNYIRKRLSLIADFYMSGFNNKKERKQIKKQAKKDLLIIHRKANIPTINMSYSNFINKLIKEK